MNPAIIIMAKVPRPGTVKTRLQTILTPEKCAELARAFLEDTLKKAQIACRNVILAYAPAHQKKFLENFVAPEIILIEQTGADLGARMESAFEYAFAEFSPVVMIGTDSPTFPARRLSEAIAALRKEAAIALGKSRDGGFYLIGLKKRVRNLFDGIEWSTPRVFAQMTANLEKLGIENLHLLPEHYDVDTPADLATLKDELAGDETARAAARKTHRWLLANREAVKHF